MSPENSEFNIRLALQEDIPELTVLLMQLFQQEAEFSPDASRQSSALKTQLAQDKSPIFVADLAGELVGMVSLQRLYSTALDAPVAILEDMIVSPSHRKLAIGSALLHAAEHWAKENDIRRITLLTDVDNFQAHRFYQKNGFEESTMIPFRKTLPSH